MPSATAFDALQRPFESQKRIDEADVVVTPGKLAVVQQAVAPAAPEGLVDPRGVQAPDAAAAVRASEPPPFAREGLARGEQLHLEIELLTRQCEADGGPKLIIDVVTRSNEFRRGRYADALRRAESASGRACGQDRREVSRNRCIHVGDKLYSRAVSCLEVVKLSEASDHSGLLMRVAAVRVAPSRGGLSLVPEYCHKYCHNFLSGSGLLWHVLSLWCFRNRL